MIVLDDTFEKRIVLQQAVVAIWFLIVYRLNNEILKRLFKSRLFLCFSVLFSIGNEYTLHKASKDVAAFYL